MSVFNQPTKLIHLSHCGYCMRKLAGREAEGSVIGAGREEDKEWGMSRRGKTHTTWHDPQSAKVNNYKYARPSFANAPQGN